MAQNKIKTADIVDANVTLAKIQDITTARLLGRATAGAGVMEEIILGTNLSFTGTTLNAAGSSGWTLTGNAGTTPGTDFVGTTDAQDFVVKTQGFERFRILNEANGTGTIDFSAQALAVIRSDNNLEINVTGGGQSISINTTNGYLNTSSLGASMNYGTAEMTLLGDSLKITKASGVQPVQFLENPTNGTEFVALQSPDSVTTSTTYILPSTQPTAGQYLKASAPVADVVTTSWDTPAGGSTATYYSEYPTPAGSTLTLGNTPSYGLEVYKNGLLLRLTTDYTVSGTTVTLVVAPIGGDAFHTTYWVGTSSTVYTKDTQTGFTGTSLTLPSTPTSAYELYRNGLLQRLTTDYTRTGTAVTLVTAAITSDTFISTYYV